MWIIFQLFEVQLPESPGYTKQTDNDEDIPTLDRFFPAESFEDGDRGENTSQCD